MKPFYSILLSLLTLYLPSCSNDDTPNFTEEENNTNQNTLIERRDISLSQEFQNAIDAQEELAFDCFQNLLATRDDNFVFSPFSYSILLGMLTNGMDDASRNLVAEELTGKKIDWEKLNTLNKFIIEELQNLDNSSQIGIYNSAWSDFPFSFKDSFKTNLETFYNAQVKSLDFSSYNSKKEINEWIKEKSEGLIPSILDNGSIGEFLLVNALYFNGKWTFPFDKSKTETSDFYNADNTVGHPEMMYLPDSELSYFFSKECDMVRLPFGNEAFSLYLAMPGEGWEYDALIDIFGRKRRRDYKGKYFFNRNTEVFLPKFEVETTIEDLTSTLKSEALKECIINPKSYSNFSEKGLNFSPTMKQKNIFKISEENAEGAATTYGTIYTFNFSEEKFRLPILKFDHPFFFMLEEQSTGIILLMGAINKL